MFTLDAAVLVNTIGFAVGIALYGLLIVMVLQHRQPAGGEVRALLLATGALGLLWNVSELWSFIARDFGGESVPPLLTAVAFSALGFLPAVVVHSARSDDEAGSHWLAYGAYVLSTAAAVLHIGNALVSGSSPSALALQTQTYGSVALAVGLLTLNFRQTVEKKAVLASALLVFALSALHLGGKTEGGAWYVELAAHQSSLPLALVILYQNYRFAFADLFLKRAISLMLVAAVAMGLYLGVAAPLMRLHEGHGPDDVQVTAILIALWVATALSYPPMHRLATWVVDSVVLRRPDYEQLRDRLALDIEQLDSTEDVLDAVCAVLRSSLTADSGRWSADAELPGEALPVSVDVDGERCAIAVTTAEPPAYRIELEGFRGGRRLLSDEVAMLESISRTAARRIDTIRVAAERFEQRYREQQLARLAAESQLTALRSQVNPHFLFNTLTTLGYLIRTSPDKAYETLLRLTHLLRRLLRAVDEFITLGEELEIVENYLDIERARFEERLAVEIDVPDELRSVMVPSLILQPLVENAIKHGISENRNGGKVRIKASMSGKTGLDLCVWDSGAGGSAPVATNGPGVGLVNLRVRLGAYYGGRARFTLSAQDGGTRALIQITDE